MAGEGNIDREQQMLLAAKSVDQALIEKDTQHLDKVFDENVLLHADRLTVPADVNGATEVKKYFAEYWKLYQYQHSPISTAANSSDKVAFTFSIDEDIKPKTGGSDAVSFTVSIWAYVFNDDVKISEIWFLRSLHVDEISKRMKQPPGDLGIPAEEYHKMREPQLGPDSGRTESLYKAAKHYSDMWATGKPLDTGSFVEGDFHEFDPLLGKDIKDRSGLEHAIKGLALMWESTSHSHKIAATPDSLKAFVLWNQQGFFKETKKNDSLYGLNLVLFDKSHKIERVVGFRQIMETEKGKLVK